MAAISFNMKAGLFLLAALIACNDAAEVPNAGAIIQQGYYRPGDIPLHSGYYRRDRIYDTIQYEDVIYHGKDQVRITYFEVVVQGESLWVIPTLRAGGVGYTHATIRLTSARGYGYYFLVRMYGRLV